MGHLTITRMDEEKFDFFLKYPFIPNQALLLAVFAKYVISDYHQ
jgi:hypothetical protein